VLQTEVTPFVSVPISQIEPRNDSSFDVVCSKNKFYLSFSLRDKEDSVSSWLEALKKGYNVMDAPSSDRKHHRKKDKETRPKDSPKKSLDSPNGSPARSGSRNSKPSSRDSDPKPVIDTADAKVDKPAKPEDEPETESSSDDEIIKISVPKPDEVVVEELPKAQSKLAKLMMKHGASANDISSKKPAGADAARTVFSLYVKGARVGGLVYLLFLQILIETLCSVRSERFLQRRKS
jgi:hypothetical protein